MVDIVGNRFWAIDIGLDLAVTRPALNGPKPPEIVAVAWDPIRSATIVRVRASEETDGDRIELYASRTLSPGGFAQAEERVAIIAAARAGESEVVIPLDLRGRWITAAATRFVIQDFTWVPGDTSELSNAIEVHVHRLRRKLGEGVVRTVRGVGYYVPAEPTA